VKETYFKGRAAGGKNAMPATASQHGGARREVLRFSCDVFVVSEWLSRLRLSGDAGADGAARPRRGRVEQRLIPDFRV